MKTLNPTFKVLLAAGGTGGHIYPALAVAEALESRQSGVRIEFVGARGGMEERIVSHAGYPLHLLPMSGFYRQLNLRNLMRNVVFPFKLMRSVMLARTFVRKFQPQWVVGFGSYASFPAVRAGIDWGCRTAVMEQNAWPGLANRRLAPRVDVVFLGNEAAARFLPARRQVLTGNPVRASIGTVSKSEARKQMGLPADAKVLLVLGGSLGARAINDAIEILAPNLLARQFRIIWQCGWQYYENLRGRVAHYPGLQLAAYIDRMDCALAAADLAICRAGALTLAELERACLPAVLIPSPHVAEDHQAQNARAYAQLGGARVIAQAELPDRLAAALNQLIDDSAQLQAMRDALSRLPQRDAAGLIADYLLNS